jgi:hypothetical protein
MMNVPAPSSRQQKEQIMATQAIHKDDRRDDRDEKKTQLGNITRIPRATEMTLEEELAEVDAAIDEAWELLEPSMRYLADR